MRPRLAVHIGRSSEDPNVVEAKLSKSWFVVGEGGRHKEIGFTAFRVDPAHPEAVVLRQALEELAKAMTDDLWRL